MLTAAKEETIFPLAALTLEQNPHQGHQLPTALLYPVRGFVSYTSRPGYLNRCTTFVSDLVDPPKSGTQTRPPNQITCSTVLPNGRTVGNYVNQLSNNINNSPGNPVPTPYGPGPNPSAPGPISVARQVYSGTNFKIMFRGQGNAAFLGDAGNFAYSAVSGNIGVPLFLTEAVAGGYALWAGHQDANGPFFMDASATAQVPAGYGAVCKGY